MVMMMGDARDVDDHNNGADCDADAEDEDDHDYGDSDDDMVSISHLELQLVWRHGAWRISRCAVQSHGCLRV